MAYQTVGNVRVSNLQDVWANGSGFASVYGGHGPNALARPVTQYGGGGQHHASYTGQMDRYRAYGADHGGTDPPPLHDPTFVTGHAPRRRSRRSHSATAGSATVLPAIHNHYYQGSVDGGGGALSPCLLCQQRQQRILDQLLQSQTVAQAVTTAATATTADTATQGATAPSEAKQNEEKSNNASGRTRTGTRTDVAADGQGSHVLLILMAVLVVIVVTYVLFQRLERRQAESIARIIASLRDTSGSGGGADSAT